MIGQRIVNVGPRKMLGQQPLDPGAIILVVQHEPQMRALHDSGEKETHGGKRRKA